jgi:hypothetical protein
MHPPHPLALVEIGERAGDAQHPVIAARREAEVFGGGEEQFLALPSRNLPATEWIMLISSASGIMALTDLLQW